MKCKECKGVGSVVFEDDVAIQCVYCWGKGRIPLWLACCDFWYEVVGTRIDRLKEWIRFTPIGNRWWRRYGKEHRARRLAASKTLFQLQALHGDRLNRLRVFADAIEINGYNVGHQYRVESRLVAEAARACEIAKERGQ